MRVVYNDLCLYPLKRLLNNQFLEKAHPSAFWNC